MQSQSPIVYLNGQWLPRSEATLDIEDRGTLFGDGVYEVLRYYHGKPLGPELHVQRLRESLRMVEIAEPADIARYAQISDELVRRNGYKDAKVYWQITRGAAPREHVPRPGMTPTALMIAYPEEPLPADQPPRAIKAILEADHRWDQCWVKSLMLLPNILARMHAAQRGAQEAILHRGERVTEATSSSLFIVVGNELHTHPADQWILGGITRIILLDLARQAGLRAVERAFTINELLAADEAIVCSTTTHINSVTHIDGKVIGSGAIGPVARKLQSLLIEHIYKVCA